MSTRYLTYTKASSLTYLFHNNIIYNVRSNVPFTVYNRRFFSSIGISFIDLV
jgi:hypothetical protein